MIQRRYRQRSLFEAAVGSLEQLIEGLVPPELERLAQRSPQSRTRGRSGTPAEVVLRMLVLKRLKGWSFAQTEGEVRQSLVYRHLARVSRGSSKSRAVGLSCADAARRNPSHAARSVLEVDLRIRVGGHAPCHCGSVVC